MSPSLSPGPTRLILYSLKSHGPISCQWRIRFQSTLPPRPKRRSRIRTALYTTLLLSPFGYLYATDTRASIHRWLAIPLIRTLYPDAEDAHEAGTHGLGLLWDLGLHPRERGNPDARGDLGIEVFGTVLDNPLGISAGLDKHADIVDGLFALGAGVVEVGGITPRPQEGNPRPRVFRVPSQEGIINRYGLNSDGAEAVAAKLRARVRRWAYEHGFGDHEDAEKVVLNGKANVPPGSLIPGRLLAVQVAKQETTPDGDIDAIRDDYVFGTKTLAKYADIIVVNVSCPNAPGYRELQQVEPLTKILTGVVRAAKAIDRETKPAVMVKVSPDEDSEEQVSSICQAVWISGVDGVIVGNTTKRRPIQPLPHTQLVGIDASAIEEKGGYSGPQLFERTVSLVSKYRRLLERGAHMYASTQEEAQDSIAQSIQRDAKNLKDPKEFSSDQPLIQLPERHASSEHAPAKHLEQKVLFCTGGIRTGKEALVVLNAGASVAQIYTAMVYGGAGTITRMKGEMRQEIRRAVEDDVLGRKP